MATASLLVEPDEMECSVCHEHFKEPKVLPCGHVLCRHCLLSWLQSQAEALCPLCRCPMIDEKDRNSGKRLADIADRFLTDRAMAALVEAHCLLSEQHVCCVCVNVAAVSMCMDCKDMFCQQCTKLHTKQSATKLHNTEKLTSLTEEKLAANYRRACAVHSDKLPEVFCPSHKVSVCLRCATTVHRQCPDVMDLEERVGEARVTFHELTAILTARETEVGQTIRHLDKQLTEIDQHTQAAIAEVTATFDEIEAAVKAGRGRLNDLIIKTSFDEKGPVSDVKNIQLGQRGKLTLHKRLVERAEAIVTRDDVTDMTPEMETLVKDLDRSITSQVNVKVTPRIELVIDPAEVTRIKKALTELGKGKGSSFDDGTSARIKLLQRSVQQLQRDLTSAQSERARFAQQVTARQQELDCEQNRVQVLEQEVKRKDDQIKRNEAEIASCKDTFRSKVKEMEQQQQRMYDQLQTELQGEKARHQEANNAWSALDKERIRHEDTIKQLHTKLRTKKVRHQNTINQLQAELEGEKARPQDIDKQLRKEEARHEDTIKLLLTKLREEKARHQDTAKQLQACSALENDASSYERQQLREFTDRLFCFHDNEGENVLLSNNQQTAEFLSISFGCGGGIVMSRDPMGINKLYEIQITERNEEGGWSLPVGVVTSPPDSLTLPDNSWCWDSAVVVFWVSVTDHGNESDSDIGKALMNLPVDSRVGVRIDCGRRLHLHVNGLDKGVVPCWSLPRRCWAMFQLSTLYRKITSLPLTDVS